MPVAAVIWDMDGTLIDSSVVVPDAFIATVAHFGGTSLWRDDVVALYSLGEPALMLARMLNRDAGQAEVHVYHRLFREAAGGVRMHAGIAEVLRRLQSEMPTAVFSGASHEAACILLEAAGLLQEFGAVIGGDEIRHPKPAPDGIIEAARRLGVDVQHVAYVGDAPTDLEASRRAGATPSAAAWGHLSPHPRPRGRRSCMRPATYSDSWTDLDEGFEACAKRHS